MKKVPDTKGLFLQTYSDEDGKVHTTEKWAMRFRDHKNITRILSLFTDLASTRETQRYVLRMVSKRKTNEQLDDQINDWLAVAPSRIAERLAEWGILPPARVHASTAIEQHIKAWGKALADKGNTEHHVSRSMQKVRDILTACMFDTLNDIQPAQVRDQIVDTVSGMSSRNKYTAACKAFCKWAVKEGRILNNPLTCLELISRKALKGCKHRVIRTVLTKEQRSLLLAKTAEAPFRWGMSGAERSLLYRVAMETGIRANEFHDLHAGAFKLDADPLRVELGWDGKTKNGDDAYLPIKPPTAELLKAHLENKLPAAKAFNIPKSDRTAQMLREDLAFAGIPAKDAAGRKVDFHALRHTFGTSLAEAGVHPKKAMDLMRHSDINLTMSYYTHTAVESRAEAVAMLPDYPVVPVEQVKEATTGGTVEPDNAQCANDKFINKSSDKKSKEETLTRCAESSCANKGNGKKVSFESTASASSATPAPKLFIEDSTLESLVRKAPKSNGNQQVNQQVDQALAELVALWPNLPQATRDGILAQARALAQANATPRTQPKPDEDATA